MAQEIPILLGVLTFLVGMGTLVFKMGSWWNRTNQPDANCVGRTEFAVMSEKLEKLHIQLIQDISSLKVEVERIEGRVGSIQAQMTALQSQLKGYRNERNQKDQTD